MTGANRSRAFMIGGASCERRFARPHRWRRRPGVRRWAKVAATGDLGGGGKAGVVGTQRRQSIGDGRGRDRLDDHAAARRLDIIGHGDDAVGQHGFACGQRIQQRMGIGFDLGGRGGKERGCVDLA